jgi:hypothetical protein
MNAKGGLAKGKSHDEGGIKAIVKSTGQRIEFEGGEVIVNKTNVADPTKLEFEGEKKTTCEILSDLNSRNNNGVTLDCDSVEGKTYLEEGGSVSDSIDYEGWKKQQRIDLFAKNGLRIPTIIYPENSLGLNRIEMPQVRSHYIDDFLDTLTEDNISYGYSIVEAKNLKPTQKEINMDRVNMISEDLVNSKYVIVSSDDYVLDGHHRWKWAEMNDKEIKILRIDLPIRELLDYLKDYPLTEYSDINTRKMEFGGSIEDKKAIISQIKSKILPRQQVSFLREVEQEGLDGEEEADDMLENVVDAFSKIPNLYKQDGKGYNSVVYLHYFNNSSDWYITEYDKVRDEFFGYTVLNGRYFDMEYGYIPAKFFRDNDIDILRKPELDFYWKIQTLNEVLEKNEPTMVQPPIERYQEQVEVKEVNLISTDWQKLIKENSFKNPFEKVQAIENMLDEKGDNPNNYSVIEKKFISEYTGIGGMEKFGAKRRDVGQGVDFDYGLLYEFFTPAKLCQIMWGLAYKHKGNLSIKNVLEPSMGAGAFISQAPINVNIDGYDINKYCYMINKILYTEDRFKFYHDSFESLFIKNYKSVKDNFTPMYDLVIGNPPYGEYGGKYAVMGRKNSEKQYTKANDFIDYFITRGLDLLVPNGLLVFVIGSVNAVGGIPFLDKKMTPSKSRIMAKSELVDAYRLGNSMFEFTSVDADIIVLRKK